MARPNPCQVSSVYIQQIGTRGNQGHGAASWSFYIPTQVLQEANIPVSTKGLPSCQNDPVANTAIRLELL